MTRETQAQLLRAVSDASGTYRAFDASLPGLMCHQRTVCLMARGDAATLLQRAVYLATMAGLSAEAIEKAKQQ